MTVALDVEAERRAPVHRAGAPEHPSLIDEAHVTDELFGFVNVPNGVWIDEDGMIVRPAGARAPGSQPVHRVVPHDRPLDPCRPTSPTCCARPARSRPIPTCTWRWSTTGSSTAARAATRSRPTRSSARSDPRTDAEATAAAEFELGQYLHRAGDHAAAIPHWREAHRLYPDNWTYKRQAWNFEDPMRQGHTDAYDGSWYEDIKKIGAENYYPEIVP